MPLSGLFAGLSLQAILLAIILGVVAFVVVEVVKSLLAPAKPISAEYKPRMVGDARGWILPAPVREGAGCGGDVAHV